MNQDVVTGPLAPIVANSGPGRVLASSVGAVSADFGIKGCPQLAAAATTGAVPLCA
jgi:hypothetical protein